MDLHRSGRPPLVIAHRGASAHAPENTLPAFRLALEAGVAWIETDVQPTSDDVPVLLHDDTLDRTTTGTGPVREITASDLGRLEAGAWFGPGHDGVPVPQLAHLLELLTPERAVLLELKGAHTREQVVAVLEVIRATPWDHRVLLQSFEVDVLRHVRSIQPDRPVGLLVEALHPDPVAACTELGAVSYNPWFPTVLAQPGVVAELHAAGIAVMVWTVDDPAVWAELTAIGVDGIITNTPAELLAWQQNAVSG